MAPIVFSTLKFTFRLRIALRNQPLLSCNPDITNITYTLYHRQTQPLWREIFIDCQGHPRRTHVHKPTSTSHINFGRAMIFQIWIRKTDLMLFVLLEPWAPGKSSHVISQFQLEGIICCAFSKWRCWRAVALNCCGWRVRGWLCSH